MKRALNFGDLGQYLTDLHNKHYNDGTITAEYNAWKRFEKVLPGFAATPISDEAVEKIGRRFREAVDDELQPLTITSYTNKLKSAVSRLERHFEATGSLQATGPAKNVPALATAASTEPDAPESSTPLLTYRDLGDYISAYRADYPNEEKGSRWLTAFNIVMARVPRALDAAIDPERTEEILESFLQIATSPEKAVAAAADESLSRKEAEHLISLKVIQVTTARSHQFWYRSAVRHYVAFANLAYAEIDAEERRKRRVAAKQAQKEAEKEAQEAAKQAAAGNTPSKKTAKKTAKKAAVKKTAKRSALKKAAASTARSAEAAVEPQAPQEPAAPVAEVLAPAPTFAPVAPQAVPADTAAPGDALTEYQFLLRPGVRVTLRLPDDLSRREALRLSRWVDSFVIDPGPEPAS